MKQLVAYITAGYPDKNFSLDLVLALKDAGVDKLELGIPFSDPVADGPIIEQANLQSLNNGFKMQTLFDISSTAAPLLETYWMGYFNPFYHKGMDFFIQQATQSGVKGFIIPDLPHEEALPYASLMQQQGLSLVSFVAPTDSKERIAHIVKDAKGFIYLVAYAGITGAHASEDLSQTIAQIKAHSQTPLFVGFGVNEKTAKERVRGADGVIVGSAFVEILLNDALSYSDKISSIAQKAKIIKEKINA
ncbi:tryptophan synthase subunit alpha [Sulfurospirillum deleyianum]|uniref:Tryptophan synthase alpha chain n=1 Tax=Sulfurospirillum deleyianum (strain ATCC 51133 / DSM 6946 / 5175) TaxID=525898 RepID=D1AZH3_SULD5|nr:tryptophan synthase subunit alpha [Sulfurospirillum deleyianum]ACZ11440.1 tryptophan synthase, alpha subunit [Sulfurospirillum deleyianum DSM 6946]